MVIIIDNIIVILAMSSFSQNMLRIGKNLAKWPHRIIKFAKHRLLTKKKNILIIGQTASPIYQKLYPKLIKSWQITQITYQSPNNINLIENQAKSQQSNQKAIKIAQNNNATNKAHTFFTKIHLNNSNYSQIQAQLEGRQYDSIIVLPRLKIQEQNIDIDDEKFAMIYPSLHSEWIMRNVFGYRLASKYLTSSGVIILSSNQQDFLKTQSHQKQHQDLKIGLKSTSLTSNELVNAQTNYLGVMIGDRDYTDVNSWSIVALSQQFAQQDSEMVADYYRLWADSQQLPMPGSFALFKRKSKTQKYNSIVYL